MDILDTIQYSLLISLGAGIIWSVFVQLLPRIMASAVTILSVLTLAAGGYIAIWDSVRGITTF
jgi:prepilin signal peptidase PulO-like enzyme (type II secretory pathway)